MTRTIWALYAAAAVCEIGGCFAFWLWLRAGRSAWLAVVGVIALTTFAVVLTRIPIDAAGRAFAAYGGVYIATSLAWLVVVEGQLLSRSDLIGSLVCLAGAGIILAGARLTD